MLRISSHHQSVPLYKIIYQHECLLVCLDTIWDKNDNYYSR